MIQAGTIFRLHRSLGAIRLEEPGSESGVADTLPEGAIIKVIGRAQFHGMLEVRHLEYVWALFESDIPASATSIGYEPPE